MSRKLSLLWLDRQLEAPMLFVYCEMLLSSDVIHVCVQISASLHWLHWKYCRSFVTKLSERLLFQPPKYEFPALGSLQRPYWCQVNAVDVLGCKQRSSKPLTHPLAWCLGRSDRSVWSSAVNHRFDFAYLEDAVTSAITTPLSFFPAPLLRPYTYQLLRLVLILSLSCLYLAVHTKPKTCLPSLNQWHLPSLPPLFCFSRFWCPIRILQKIYLTADWYQYFVAQAMGKERWLW